jgi:hypothetical protein
MLPGMRYTSPDLVIYPKEKIEIIDIVYDGNDGTHEKSEVDVSLAKVKWDGESHLAIRWNVAAHEYDDQNKVSGASRCIGMPSFNGNPEWFIIPKETFDINSAFFKNVIEKLGTSN